jgi:hypothetical protein
MRRRRRTGNESEAEGGADCLYCAGLFSEDSDSVERVRCQKCLKRAHTFIANYRKRPFKCDRCEK